MNKKNDLKIINKTIRFNKVQYNELLQLKDALGFKDISKAVRYAVHEQLQEVQNNEQ